MKPKAPSRHGERMSLLTDGVEQLGLEFGTDTVERLDAYLAELTLWNKHRDLVNASGDRLVIKHVLDSLAGVGIVSKLPHSTMSDVGSGAGFPGIPLALFIEDCEISLIERSSKRAAFLRTVVTLLDLRDRVEVIERDVEDLHREFSLVTFRAFRNLTTFAPILFGMTGPFGSVVAFKGKRSVVERELVEIEPLVASAEIHPVGVPGMEEERNIVVIRPREATPATR